MPRAAMVLILGSLMGCSERPADPPAPSARATAEIEEIAASLKERSMAQEEKEQVEREANTLIVGESREFDGVLIKVVEVYYGKGATIDPLARRTGTRTLLYAKFTVENTSDGEVFKPRTTARVSDNFGNLAKGLGHLVMVGNQEMDDLKPGKIANIVVGVEPLLHETATSYTWTFSTKCGNQDNEWVRWRMVTNRATIKHDD